MKIEEAIVELNNLIDKSFCKDLIAYIDYKAKNKMSTVVGINEDIRNVQGYTLGQNLISDQVHFKHIQSEITHVYSHYKFKFPQISTSYLTQIDLLKYSPGGKYEMHTDYFPTQRTLTVILNLNDEYEGGDFIFYQQNGKEEMKRIKCKTGTIIFFPSNFLFPHKVEAITKGIRYSVVSWLI